MITSPAEVLTTLEAPARHLFHGTFVPRFGTGIVPDASATPAHPNSANTAAPPPPADLTEPQRLLLRALALPHSVEELCELVGRPPSELRAEATLLEIRGLVRWDGSRLARR
jgi:hypothetical protein